MTATGHDQLKLDLHCAACGYGIARLHPPERCPMCGGNGWQQRTQRHAVFGVRVATPYAPTTTEAERWLPTPRS